MAHGLARPRRRHSEVIAGPEFTMGSRGEVLLELYERLCEHVTIEPTFYCDFPADVSPPTPTPASQ